MGQSVYFESPIKLIRKVLTSRSPGQAHFTGDQIRNWVLAEYPEVTEERFKTNLTILSTNDLKRLGHPVHLDPANDFLFLESQGVYRLYRQGIDPHPLKRDSRHLAGAATKDRPTASVNHPSKTSKNLAFRAESALRDQLAMNLEAVEAGLHLYYCNGRDGIEFPAGGKFIDILAVDKDGAFVVLELKKGKADYAVVGQLSTYMQWVRENLANGGIVRGIVVSREHSKSLQLALRGLPNAQLKAYSLQVT